MPIQIHKIAGLNIINRIYCEIFLRVTEQILQTKNILLQTGAEFKPPKKNKKYLQKLVIYCHENGKKRQVVKPSTNNSLNNFSVGMCSYYVIFINLIYTFFQRKKKLCKGF